MKDNSLGRNWTFLLYPDSMNKDYTNILNNLHVQWCESPIHDQDIRSNGEKKKPHIHIILSFEGNKSYSQILEIANSVHGVIAPLDSLDDCPRVQSLRGMVRYLIHKDDPDKFQYEFDKIKVHGGMDIEQYFQYAQAVIKKLIGQMLDFCTQNDIFEYSDLLMYAYNYRYDDWYDLLTVGHQSWILKSFLDSYRFKLKEANKGERSVNNNSN